MKKISIFSGIFLTVALLAAAPLQAATYTVQAKDNSSTDGVGLNTITLIAGQAFTVTVDTNDLWSAGDLPRWSNANGLQGDLFATGSDESQQLLGTKIGRDFGQHTQGAFSAYYGSLVGQIGSGDYFLIGTNYSGSASATGTLNLFYWDSYAPDNVGKISANVNAVPLPAAVWLFGSAIIGMFGIGYRRNANTLA